MMLYLDSDGVLADFNERWFRFFEEDAETLRQRMTKEELWDAVHEVDPEFFLQLQPMPDAYELFDAVQHLDHAILTGSPTPIGYIHKPKWFMRWFMTDKVIVCQSKEKHLHCKPGDILVDDRTKYRSEWENVGGIFVHHKTAKDTLGQLKEMNIL